MLSQQGIQDKGSTVWRELMRASTSITVPLLGRSETIKEFALATTLSPDGHSTQQFTTGAETNIIAEGGPAPAPNARDADALVDAATVADSGGEKKVGIAITDNQTRSDVAFAVYMNAGNG